LGKSRERSQRKEEGEKIPDNERIKATAVADRRYRNRREKGVIHIPLLLS
jgi:hypothetical protein